MALSAMAIDWHCQARSGASQAGTTTHEEAQPMPTDTAITARDRLTAAALVAAPVVLGAGLVIHPKEVSGESEQLMIIGHHLSAWGCAHVLIYLGAALLIPAVIGLVRLAD